MSMLGSDFEWSEIAQIVLSIVVMTVVVFALCGGFHHGLMMVGILKTPAPAQESGKVD